MAATICENCDAASVYDFYCDACHTSQSAPPKPAACSHDFTGPQSKHMEEDGSRAFICSNCAVTFYVTPS